MVDKHHIPRVDARDLDAPSKVYKPFTHVPFPSDEGGRTTSGCKNNETELQAHNRALLDEIRALQDEVQKSRHEFSEFLEQRLHENERRFIIKRRPTTEGKSV